VRARFACLDCREDVSKIKEYCMLVDDTWYQIHNSERGMLCVGCIETRLGRQLHAADFNSSYLNTSRSFERSARLLDRMTNETQRVA
jgi:DNA replication protein DnaC